MVINIIIICEKEGIKMFIGRETELESLTEHYQSDQFECAIIYGRRRIGKTELISHFSKDRPSIFYTATQENAESNLIRMSNALNFFENSENHSGPVYQNFDQLLDRVAELSKKKRIIFVIDEYPYLAESYPGFSSLLQAHIDQQFKNTKLFLILCGSSMSFMEKQVLGYQSPLYGRRTLQLKLEPFSFNETQQMLPNVDKADAFALHAISGGIPQYLSYFANKRSVKEAIIDCFLKKDGRLFEEPNNLLKQELRELANYNSIISAIANGASRLNDIAMTTKIPATSIKSYLDNLSELEIIQRKVPITEINKRSKKAIYQINDGMFRFWYRFVPARLTLIERGMTDIAWNGIESNLNHFLGPAFEKLAQDYLWNHYDVERTPFTNLGNWWGADKRTREQVELDILGFSSDNPMFGVFGECKWRNEPISKDILEKLIFNSNLFNYPKKYYYLFSKVGLTDECQKLAKEIDCKLITFKEM